MNKRIKTKKQKQNTVNFLIEMVGNNTNNQFYLQKQIELMTIEIKQLQYQISDLNKFNNLRSLEST